MKTPQILAVTPAAEPGSSRRFKGRNRVEGDKSTCFINIGYVIDHIDHGPWISRPYYGLEISQGNKTIPIAYMSWMNKIKMADMTDISKFIS